MSPFQSLRTFLFGGSPRSSAPPQEMGEMEEQPNDTAQGPTRPSPLAIQTRRLTQMFHNTESEAMLVDVPTFARLSYDAVEYYCHVMMHSTSRDAILEYIKDFDQCIKNIGDIHTYGRLTCRIFIVALCQDICCANPGDEDDDDGVIESLLNADYNKWVDLKDRLFLIRNMLITKGADLFVFPGVDATNLPPENNEVDPTKLPLPMFAEYYDDLVQKFLVQMAIAQFRERLAAIEPEPGEHVSFLKIIEAAVDEYKATLTETVFKDDDVPASLTAFLLQDLYQSNRGETSLLPAILKQDVEKILLDESNAYSFRMLQNDVRSLLRRWHSTLTTPELVRLGYGGVRETVVEDDNRSVSSWGADEHLNDGKQMLSQPQARREAVEDGSDDEGIPPIATATDAIEPIPHDSFEEEPLSSLQEQVIREELTVQESIGAPIESGDDSEPLLQREVDSIRKDKYRQDRYKALSVTPTQMINRKRKTSSDIRRSKQSKRQFRNQPLRLEGFTSSEDEDEPETPRMWVEHKRRPTIRSPSKPRRIFTIEETEAIREGVKRFGPGNWAVIKYNCDGILDNRTSVQIKDKYRTMVQNGEL